MQKVAPKTLNVCRNLIGEEVEIGNALDFANVCFNCDFYIAIQDYITSRILVENHSNAPSFDEILQMIKVWLLQFIYRTTSTNIFEKKSWFAKIESVGIRKQQYRYLFSKLGEDKPQLDEYMEEENDKEKDNDKDKKKKHKYEIKSKYGLIPV